MGAGSSCAATVVQRHQRARLVRTHLDGAARARLAYPHLHVARAELSSRIASKKPTPIGTTARGGSDDDRAAASPRMKPIEAIPVLRLRLEIDADPSSFDHAAFLRRLAGLIGTLESQVDIDALMPPSGRGVLIEATIRCSDTCTLIAAAKLLQKPPRTLGHALGVAVVEEHNVLRLRLAIDADLLTFDAVAFHRRLAGVIGLLESEVHVDENASPSGHGVLIEALIRCADEYTLTTAAKLLEKPPRTLGLALGVAIIDVPTIQLLTAAPNEEENSIAAADDDVAALPTLKARFDVSGELETFDEAAFLRRLAILVGVEPSLGATLTTGPSRGTISIDCEMNCPDATTIVLTAKTLRKAHTKISVALGVTLIDQPKLMLPEVPASLTSMSRSSKITRPVISAEGSAQLARRLQFEELEHGGGARSRTTVEL